MAKPKTIPTGRSVSDFLNTIEDEKKRAEGRTIEKTMREATGNRARMRGTRIVGFGTQDYRYASRQEGSWSLVGLSPRKQNLTLYMMPGFSSFGKLDEPARQL